MLRIGTILKSQSGNVYQVIRLLGAGGQGEVYEVESNNTRFALKWYFASSATSAQKTILEDLIGRGSPDKAFLWPQDFVSGGKTQFGYVMNLRPSNFKGIVDMMKRRAEPSFANLCRAAFNLISGYEKLHAMGYSYRDISFGNVFFSPDNGDILICDNDNVSVSAESSVYGTPRFMAPEIVLGRASPSRNTDLFSLAVLLFYMLMLNHPLEGRLEAEIKCMDIYAMNQLYGKNPVFIFDPNNKTNRPVKGYQDNAIIYWGVYPKKIRDLFTISFTVGLNNPEKRITEKQWMDAFANLIFGIVPCSCSAENFCDYENTNGATCWNCNKALTKPTAIQIGKSRVVLTSDTKICSHHTKANYDIANVVGTVVQNPNNPNLWGIRNEESTDWTYIKADGTQISVASGKTAAITKGAKINFGLQIGEFI